MPYLTVKESAEIASRNERTIRRWIKAGKVKYTEIKGKYHVEENSLGVYLGKHRSSKIKHQRSNIKDQRSVEAQSPITNNQRSKSSRGSITNHQSPIIKDQRSVEAQSPITNRQDPINNVRPSENDNGHNTKSTILMTPRKFHLSEVERKAGRTVDMSELRKVAGHMPNYLQEGVEYEMSGQTERMSEYAQNNMSVKISPISPIVSNSNINQPGEMSDLSTLSVSDSRVAFDSASLQKTDSSAMSVRDGHLPTQTDIHVDKYFDRHGIIGAETPFFPDMSDVSKNVSKYSDNIIGHNDRTLKMSAYAVRLIEEKERVAKKFEEQNDFLKGELSELRKEISALRGVIAQEGKNRSSTSDFLLESYRKMEDRLDNQKHEYNKLGDEIMTPQKKDNQDREDYTEPIGTYGYTSTHDDMFLRYFYYMIMGLIGLVVFGVMAMIIISHWS